MLPGICMDYFGGKSVASVVGFIALAGVAAEFGVIMLLYLKQAWASRLEKGLNTDIDLLDAIREGAVLRVRPKAMTVAVIVAGLLPLFWGAGAGSDREPADEVGEREELLRGEITVGELVAEEHPDDRGDREGVEDPGLLAGREAEARQVAEDERQPRAPDEKLERHHREERAAGGPG